MGENNTLPEDIIFGSSIYNPDVAQQVNIKEHVTNLCELFREEFVTLVERIHSLYLESKFRNKKIKLIAN